MLQQWYHLDGQSDEFDSKAAPLSTVLLESDSDRSDRDILVQSDSDREDMQAILPASDDDEILLATQSDDGQNDPPTKRRRYTTNRTVDHKLSFLQQPVCRYAHMRLYAIGSGALQNMRKGNPAFTMESGRLQEPKHPSIGVSLVRSSVNQKWPSIMAFFWLLWISCAEILPIQFTMPGQDGGKYKEHVMSEDPDFQERYVQNFLACIEKNYDVNPATQLKFISNHFVSGEWSHGVYWSKNSNDIYIVDAIILSYLMTN